MVYVRAYNENCVLAPGATEDWKVREFISELFLQGLKAVYTVDC